MARLGDVDLSLRLSKQEESVRLAPLQKRVAALRLQMGGMLGDHRLGPPLCIVFEGWDASGKGGTIKRLVAQLDARHARVAEFAAPSKDERRHHFLARFWPALPGWGGMAVLDRSWYGRVLVERVEEFASRAEWERAYGEIIAFEQSLVDEGAVLVKLWMHLSEEQQKKRFQKRRENPLKAWKLTEEDWRNRAKRAQYEEAVEDMLVRTSLPHAPWHLVPAESKRYARVHVLGLIISAMEDGLRRYDMEPVDVAEVKS